jgi:hypothetical protein
MTEGILDKAEAVSRNILVCVLLALDIGVLGIVDRDVFVIEQLLEILTGLIVDVLEILRDDKIFSINSPP